VTFDGQSNTVVNVGGNYAYDLTGICGNCDGIQNDYRTKAGVDVSRDSNKYNLVADSYQVPDDSDVPTATCLPGPPIPDKPCSTDGLAEAAASSRVCGFEKLDDQDIRACFDSKKLNMADLKASCEMDYCLNYDDPMRDTIRCNILAGVFEQCYQAGFSNLNWRALYNCEMNCDGDWMYVPAANPCPITCNEAKSGVTTKSCPNAVIRDGCECFDGYFTNGGSCKEAFFCQPS